MDVDSSELRDINRITYRPIGVIRSSFTELSGMPIQPTSELAQPGFVEIYPDFEDGLKDLGGFSHLILLYHMHKAQDTQMFVTPFLDKVPRGVFATRAPTRPNPIGISVVKLQRVEQRILHVEALDVLDGTPLLDIKPYVPDFIPEGPVRVGWLAHASGSALHQSSDDRFT
jgi:tRNA-Thr(GGU) m(6)t(6)A37 methyltransferase TsaA